MTHRSADVSRRALTRGVGWTAPVVALSAAVPAIAASPIPGLNGWITFKKSCVDSPPTFTIDGNGDGTRYPNGQGYGIYVLNTKSTTTISGAKIRIYLPSTLSLTFTAFGAASNWSVPTVVAGDTSHRGFTAYETSYSGGWVFNATGTPTYTIANSVPQFRATMGKTYCSTSLPIYIHRYVTVDGKLLEFERQIFL